MQTVTPETLNAHLTGPSPYGTRVVKALTCADGFRVSVQASATHYCSPRENTGPYYEVELGYPSAAEDSLMQYAENADKPTDTVYGWVPITLVCDVLNAHGGLK